MGKELTGRIYDIQGFSVQDGPGIRTTVFLKGCPFRCPWCHSPESQLFEKQLCWISMKCAGIAECGACIEACPKRAISPGELRPAQFNAAEGGNDAASPHGIQQIHIDRDLCDNCGECITSCVRKALYLCGTDYTVDEVLTRVRKDLPFYQQSGGGVTISGGEALAQPEFTLQLLRALREQGIHTALDTTGHAPFRIVEPLLPYTDLFLYDLKHMNSQRHRMAVGVGNELILENASRIAGAGGRFQIRIPIIPEFNDSEENIRATGAFCHSLGAAAVRLVQLLPYHNLGIMKHQRLDDTRIVLEAAPPSEEKMASIKQLLEGFGLPVTVH